MLEAASAVLRKLSVVVVVALYVCGRAQQNMHLTRWILRLRATFPQPQKYQRQKRILLPPPRR